MLFTDLTWTPKPRWVPAHWRHKNTAKLDNKQSARRFREGQDRPERGPLWIWIGTVIADFVVEAVTADEVVEDLAGVGVSHGWTWQRSGVDHYQIIHVITRWTN
jgi:hypothetical protein